MSDDSIPKSQFQLWMLLGAAFILGLSGAIFAPAFPYPWMQRISEDLGLSLITASILGITVDRALKIEIVRDVFNVAFRYVLPPELKEEIFTIINYRFICDRHLWHLEIEKLDDANFVRVTSTLTRRLKNITAHAEKLRLYIHIDDWGYKNESSKVLECKVTLEDGTVVLAKEQKEINSTIRAEGAEQTIKPGERATFVSKWSEIRQTNDAVYLNIGAPTINPEIEVRVPHGFQFSRAFGSSSEKLEMLGDREILSGTFLPQQLSVVRWWPKKAT